MSSSSGGPVNSIWSESDGQFPEAKLGSVLERVGVPTFSHLGTSILTGVQVPGTCNDPKA